ncbi:MAG: hypothetical protein U9Q05_05865 [Thermodesulfobacteriota bacterium]|nr:hypothetical protein [Thermodesulfobacteriota bacterium]
MSVTKISKQEIDRFSRVIVMLFNRATMYQTDHPYVQQSIDELYKLLGQLLPKVSPLVFIMSREQLFVDEEPLDPRIIVTKIVQHFGKTGIQSISFESGLKKNDIRVFLDIFTALDKYSDSDAMKNALIARGVRHVKINHVVYIKATEDDELVSRDALKEMTLDISQDSQQKTKKQFMDLILESVLAEDFEKTMTIDNLLKNPQGLSQKMIEADRAGFQESQAEDRRPGPVLMHQLEMINQEISGNQSQINEDMATDLVTAVFEMKNELLEGMQSQKADNVTYSDETEIIAKINEVTDNVVLQLSKKHDLEGASTSKFGQGLGRWVPEDELDEMVDRIKTNLADKPIAIEHILNNPAGVSKQLVEADIAGFNKSGENRRNPGSILMQRLDLVKQELVNEAFQDSGSTLSDVAAAVLELKEQLLAGMESQKALGTVYVHEDKILDRVTDISDDVILQLVKEEYQAGQLSPKRLAQILRRLIPETDELKRLLPKIKTVLLQAGMPLKDYLEIVKTLGKELQSEELAKVFEESAEQIGIDGESLVQEIKKNPDQAAELIFLASEIRKGTGDEKIMTDLLVDYVERLGSSLNLDMDKDDEVKGKEHLRRIIGNIESDIVGRLKNMNVKDDLIGRLEERLESRMDEIFEKAKDEWLQSPSDKKDQGDLSELSILKIMEQSVFENEELIEILELVRNQAESGVIDENNFEQIYLKIKDEEQKRRLQEEQRQVPPGVVKDQILNLLMKKEVSRAQRYGVHLAALAFSLVGATPVDEDLTQSVSHQILIDAILKKMVKIVRSSDLIGEFGKNEIVVLLPFTPPDEAQRTLKRCLQLLYLEPIEVNDASFTIKMAGVARNYDLTHTPDADVFINELSNELMQMEIRIRNIQNLLK